MVRTSFIGIDADAILRNPIRGRGEDLWAWEPEKHGIYSVKSAYKLLDTRRQQLEDVAVVVTSDDVTWRRIWKLDVPPKVKVFWWRMIHEFLPAKQVLHGRHIEPVATCDPCGNQEESIGHVLMDCTIAKIFWEQTKELTGVKSPRLRPGTWTRDLLVLRRAQERAIIICGTWSFRMQRNKRRHGEASTPISQAVMWVRDTAFDLWQILHPPKQSKSRMEQLNWVRPERGWVKCNVDMLRFKLRTGVG